MRANRLVLCVIIFCFLSSTFARTIKQAETGYGFADLMQKVQFIEHNARALGLSLEESGVREALEALDEAQIVSVSVFDTNGNLDKSSQEYPRYRDALMRAQKALDRLQREFYAHIEAEFDDVPAAAALKKHCSEAGRAFPKVDQEQTPRERAELEGQRKSCEEQLLAVYHWLEGELKALREEQTLIESEIAALDAEIAKEKTPERKKELQAEKQEKEAQLEETKKKIEKRERQKGKINLGKIILGAALAIGGVLVATFVPGGQSFGAGMAVAGGNLMKEGYDEAHAETDLIKTSQRGTGHYIRKGVATNAPSQEARLTEFDAVAKDPGKTMLGSAPVVTVEGKNISQGEEGNFMVFAQTSAAGTTWVLRQISPGINLEIIEPGEIAAFNENDVGIGSWVELVALNPKVIEVVDPNALMGLRFIGSTTSGRSFRGSLTQLPYNQGQKSFTVDVELTNN